MAECDPPEVILTGGGLAAFDPDDDCVKQLSGEGIPVHDGSGVEMKDGSVGKEIALPNLKALLDTAKFPVIIIQNAAGEFIALPATAHSTPKMLVAKNGLWQQLRLTPPVCYDDDDICECPYDYIAGWKLNDDGSLCLVKLSLETLFEDIPISAQEGNRLQLLEDGLFVGPEY